MLGGIPRRHCDRRHSGCRQIFARQTSVGETTFANLADEIFENRNTFADPVQFLGRDRIVRRIPEADELIATIYDINQVRAAICANYLAEMQLAIAEMSRVLRTGGKAVIVIGDNTVCGYPFLSSYYLRRMLEDAGLRQTLNLVDGIKSRGLLTKRSGGAAAIAHETILVFEK